MTRLFSTIAFAITLVSCTTNSSNESSNADTIKAATTISSVTKNDTIDIALADTAKVKAWLIGVIEDYRNSQDPNLAFDNLKKSLTDNYYNYKQDAINLEYDNGDTTLTEERFKKKWQDRYNIKFVGNGGFLISAQDNGIVKVTKCAFIKHLGQNASLYKVQIDDLDFKVKFNRDFKIVTENGKLLIDDVIEYD